MEIRVIVTGHARTRIAERGDSVVSISRTVKEASSQIVSDAISAGSQRVALKSPLLTTVPVVEVSPRRYGVGLVVVTVLPRTVKGVG